MNFRREFTANGGLSVTLVVISSVVLGLLFAWIIPDLGIWWGIALGAIVSPTDAVAVSIVRAVGASPRVVSVLDGESLLNDATALVLLRTANVAIAASISLWSVIGTFAYSVVIAVISFTVPFLASIRAEL